MKEINKQRRRALSADRTTFWTIFLVPCKATELFQGTSCYKLRFLRINTNTLQSIVAKVTSKLTKKRQQDKKKRANVLRRERKYTLYLCNTDLLFFECCTFIH